MHGILNWSARVNIRLCGNICKNLFESVCWWLSTFVSQKSGWVRKCVPQRVEGPFPLSWISYSYTVCLHAFSPKYFTKSTQKKIYVCLGKKSPFSLFTWPKMLMPIGVIAHDDYFKLHYLWNCPQFSQFSKQFLNEWYP